MLGRLHSTRNLPVRLRRLPDELEDVVPLPADALVLALSLDLELFARSPVLALDRTGIPLDPDSSSRVLLKLVVARSINI